jgi:hypothetical protein
MLFCLTLLASPASRAQIPDDNPFHGDCWNSDVMYKTATKGVFWSKAEGVYVLKFQLRTSSKECNYPDGTTTPQDCKHSKDPSWYGVRFVLDPKAKTLQQAMTPDDSDEGYTDVLGPVGEQYEYKYKSEYTGVMVDGWKLSPLEKLKPCPAKDDGKGGVAVYCQKPVPVFAGPSQGGRDLSPNCFRGKQGEIFLRVQRKPTAVNGDSSRCDSTSVSTAGWTYFVIDASASDPAWQNTLGLRALTAKKYAEAKQHFLTALKSEPTYRHANYNLACTLSLTQVPFKEGKGYLVTLLKELPSEKMRKRYVKKIMKDKDLDFWRKDPAFAGWLAEVK